MTFTYTSTDPGGTTRDTIRLQIGDTSSSDQLLQDEEIAYFGNAPACARAIAAKFGRRVDERFGNASLSASQMSERYLALADMLEQTASYGGVPYTGGISIADKDSVADDTDRVVPGFSVGQDDYPGTMRTGTLSSE